MRVCVCVCLISGFASCLIDAEADRASERERVRQAIWQISQKQRQSQRERGEISNLRSTLSTCSSRASSCTSSSHGCMTCLTLPWPDSPLVAMRSNFLCLGLLSSLDADQFAEAINTAIMLAYRLTYSGMPLVKTS